MTTAAQPNILFVFADDWGRYASTYRQVEGTSTPNAIVDTPHFDRVAREGCWFSNAFVPAPSCTPCRSSVLTGRYFWQTERGAILQGAVWNSNIPSYPLRLKGAGYHIGFTYKVWSPGTPPDQPYGGERNRYAPAGNLYNNYSHHVARLMRDEGMALDAAREVLYDEVRGNFEAFLEARPDGAPFAYWWGPTNTHRTWERGSGKDQWGLDPDKLKGRLPAFLPDVPEVREDVADYLGECQAVDAGLGILMKRIEELGELDNTLIVVSGDHGIPGFPRGKCNLYDIGCEVALAARWPGHIPPGRRIDDMVNIMDLTPTFLEAGGAQAIPGIAGKSLMPLLTSPHAGQIDPDRTWVVLGRERHVAAAREGNLPYPQRCIRTHDYLYIRNYMPDRWPMGDPRGLDDPDTPAPDFDLLCRDTFAAYADLDASPTKAWMIHHRAEDDVWPLYQIGFGKYPGEELYDVNLDPDHLHNLLDDPDFHELRDRLAAQLLAVQQAQQDPRITEVPCRFERPPFTDKA